MMKPESKRTIAIEDLLRLKRAERPPAEFWSQFERELRAKQLAALMARRPWWQRLPSVAPFFVRHRILIGATAVLAVTVVSLRNPRPSPVSVANAERVTAPVNLNVSPIAASVSTPARSTDVEVVASERTVSFSAVVAGSATLPQGDVVTLAAATSQLSAGVEPQVGLPISAVKAEVQPPVPRFVATGLAVASLDTATTRGLGTGFEGRVAATRTTVEPLHQMTSPSETRRARFLTAMVSMAALEAPVRSTERAANRIDEERLYEQVSRFGARGDRLNVKF